LDDREGMGIIEVGRRKGGIIEGNNCRGRINRARNNGRYG
jgi:hypothetical protein